MNHLAHFHLAGDDPAYLLGALLGDHVKGELRGHRPDPIERGIRLHRRIDALTDEHPAVRALLARFPPGLRRYGGIALDVCFDRCLSRDWQHWHPQPLPQFCADVFDVLERNREHLTGAAITQFRRLQRYDTLLSLRHWDTVERVLAAIGERLRHANPLPRSVPVLRSMSADIDTTFAIFYPQLQQQLRTEFKY